MNQADMENSLRALLAERAQHAPIKDGLAEQIITQAATGIVPPRQLHRPAVRRHSWAMPLLAAAAVAAVVAGTVGFLVAGHTSAGHGISQAIGDRSTAPAPSTSPSSITTSPPRAANAFIPVNVTESNGATLVHLAAFKAVDLTFVGPNIWAMGSATCIAGGSGRCSALVHSTDGVHWSMLNNTPFNVADDTAGCATACAEHIRFATPTIGYIYGPNLLLMTKDAGRTWQTEPGGAVALETLDGNVVKVSASDGCSPPGCSYIVQVVTVGSTDWQTVPLHGAYPGDGVSLARTGSWVYLQFYGNPAGGAQDEQSTLFVSDNDGATWTDRGEVCQQKPGQDGEVDSTAVTGGSDGSIIVACQPRLASPASPAWVTVAATGASSFHRAPGTLPSDYPSLVGGATAQDFCVQETVLYCTRDGGASFAKAHTSNGDTVNAVWLGFENTRDGRALQIGGTAASPSSDLWTTHDGGLTWSLTVGIG